MKVIGDDHFNFNNFRFTIINTALNAFEAKQRELKTEAERRAFFSSPEAVKLRNGIQSYNGTLSADGTFWVEDVVPGDYNVSILQFPISVSPNGVITTFGSVRVIIVPKAKDQKDDSEVNEGVIELEKKVPSTGPSAGVEKK